MANLRLMDMHTHTDNSPDGFHSTMFMCETAMLKGLRAIAFTDHYDFHEFEKLNYEKRSAYAFFDMSKARAAFMGKLLVLAGIELGEATYSPAFAEKALKRSYDMVLGSIHNLRDKPDFKELDYSEIDVNAYLTEYFDELITLSAWPGCDVIAHLTCPLRYITGRAGIAVELSLFSQQIDAVLENIVKTGKALEINTSELFGQLGESMPGEGIIRRYRELGGEYVTVGSDAHIAENIGRGIPEAVELARRCGFDKLTFFQSREPMQIEI